MLVVADDKIPLIRGVLEPFGIDVTYLPGGKISPADVLHADALLTRTRTRCNAALLEHSDIRLIATATIGFDHIDTNYLAQRGIAWCNAPGCNAASVGQYLASVLLELAIRHDFDLRGKTLGIIGVGNVGTAVATIAQALGMNLLLNDPPRAERGERFSEDLPFVELEQLLEKADILTLHVPLERVGKYPTFHLIDSALLRRLKPSQFVINAARGEVVDNAALKHALQEKLITGAVLDVWENEPEIDRELLELVECGTPHIAGYSLDGKANGSARSIQALAEFFQLAPELKKWYPQDMPRPETTLIVIPETANSTMKRVDFAVKASYDAMQDCQRLRHTPETFERQRGDYPLRREFPIFTVKSSSLSHDAAALEILRNLGFGME